MKKYQRTLQTNDLHIREKGEGEESRTIEGSAIVFNTVTTLYEDDECVIREQILPDAVPQSLLDRSDIKMTLFHDNHLLLARSVNGKGTLSYTRTEKEVRFSFEAPHTVDGDKALELVRSGILTGCSFAFSVYDWETHADRKVTTENGKRCVLYSIKELAGIHDFTIAADPAYPTTEVSARCKELATLDVEDEKKETGEAWREQVREMRSKISINKHF